MAADVGCFVVRRKTPFRWKPILFAFATFFAAGVILPSCSQIKDVFGTGGSDPDSSYLEKEILGFRSSSEARRLDISPDGNTVAMVLSDKLHPAYKCARTTGISGDAKSSHRVVALSLETGERLFSIPHDSVYTSTYDGIIGDARFSPDGSLLAAGHVSIDSLWYRVAVWRTSDWQLVSAIPHTAHAVAFSHDGSRLYTGGGETYFGAPHERDSVVFCWNTETWECDDVFLKSVPLSGGYGYWGSYIPSLHVSRDGSILISGQAAPEYTYVWSLASVIERPVATTDIYSVIGFGESATQVLAKTPQSAAAAVCLVDITTGDVQWRSDRQYNCAAVSYDGRWLVTGSDDGTVSVYRTTDGARVRYMSAGGSPIDALVVSRDNSVIAA